MKRTLQLLKSVGLSWLAFLVVGLAIAWLAPIPKLTVLLDRSYCPANQWQQVAQAYSQLYDQHQHRRLILEQVVMVSDLGQDAFASPPTPDAVRQISTYGQRDGDRLSQLQSTYSNSEVLGCSSQN
ncbi:MAG: hypothetical protein AAGD25_40640 [Cyanobacteria bacterium P01_F01_bin.150]